MSRRAFWALTVSASLVHAALTVPFAGRKDLWKDDAYSMVVATKSLSKIVGYLWHREAAMAPFYMLLHFWARVSRDPGVLRLLPIAFAVAVPPLVAIAVKPRMGERRAVAAALLMACNPFAVFLALQLRAYSMVVVGAAVALIGADRLDRRARSGDPTQRRRRPRPQNLEISRLTCSNAPQSQPSRIRTATFWFLEA